MFGSLDIKTRPLRLAYLVEPNNPKQVREAIRLSSTLWGGDYFPIVPLYKRMPATWRDKPLRAPAAKSVILGYLEAFDPDVLVEFSKDIPDYVSNLGLEIIKPEEIWRPLDEESWSPEFGLGIFELLNEIFDIHFKYKQKYPVKVIFPKIPQKFSLFWASWFGDLPETMMPILKEHYFDPLEIKVLNFQLNNLGELFRGDTLFPRRITRHGIHSFSRAGFHRDAHVFYMDATKVEDIVDFWNLRAVGKYALPLPKQLQTEPEMKRIVVDFLKANRHPWKHDKTVCDVASLLRSRNSTMDEMKAYAKSLNIERDPDDPSTDGFLTLQHWYPRIWDEWARDKDFVVPNDIYAEEEETIEVADTKEIRIQFRPLLPKFADKFGYQSEPRCANEINFRFYGSDEYIAEVFPKSSGSEFDRAISGLTSFRRDWRVGRNGLVKLVRDKFNETREIPLAEKVFFAWLKDLGWEAKLSPSGLLAKQIFKKLEGHPTVLKNEKLLGLLEHMNGGFVTRSGDPVEQNKVEQERELSVGEVKNRLASEPPGDLHDYLISRGVFRLGVRMQCPHCTRSPWFPLEQVGEIFTCPKCLNTFPAIGHLNSATWCYKTAGPFSLPRYADGAYAVILTLDFFDDRTMTTLRITPALSFVAERSSKKKLEADFAAFWQQSIYGEKQDGVLFGECKTYGVFDNRDFKRMRYLAKTFPGAILVFSTLRKKLTPREIKEITRIAKSGRKYWKAERPINPVLILTGTELLDRMGPPYCWDEATRKKFSRARGLVSLCDVTQQLYLGLSSWHEDWHKKWEKKRGKRLTTKRVS